MVPNIASQILKRFVQIDHLEQHELQSISIYNTIHFDLP